MEDVKMRTAKEIWASRNPQHDINANTGKDMFWGTVEMCFKDYADERTKLLHDENKRLRGLLEQAFNDGIREGSERAGNFEWGINSSPFTFDDWCEENKEELK